MKLKKMARGFRTDVNEKSKIAMHKIKFTKGRFSPDKTYIRYGRGSGQVRVDFFFWWGGGQVVGSQGGCE